MLPTFLGPSEAGLLGKVWLCSGSGPWVHSEGHFENIADGKKTQDRDLKLSARDQ